MSKQDQENVQDQEQEEEEVREKAEYRPPATQQDLDRIIEQRLARERAKYADYDALKAKAARLDEMEEATKTELQKALDAAAEASRRADEEALARIRAEVAHAKGLTPGQAKRLVGSTREELEADADEILAEFTPVGEDHDDSRRRPKERLRSGVVPDAGDEPDIDGVVARVRRF